MNIPLSALIKEGLNGLLDLMYPPLCQLCSEKLESRYNRSLCICAGCLTKIKKNRPPYCEKCGRSLSGTTDTVINCWECAGGSFYYEKSRSCYLYEGGVKEALHLFKYSKKVPLSRMFCGLLIESLIRDSAILENVDLLVAVPLHSVKLREREFNQAHVLLEAVAGKFKIKDASACLKRALNTRPQSDLDKKERFNNVRGTFTADNFALIKEKNILLIDDIYTTGATLNECARVLKKAGAGKISCLTFARGE